MIDFIFKSVTYLFTALAFLAELPIRLISLLVLILFFAICVIFAPITAVIAKKGLNITNWTNYALYFKGGFYCIVYNAYKKAFGL